MIFRIDIQHFLNNMIDYFTKEELLHFQYAIISAKIRNQGRCQNVVKLNDLYPDSDTIIAYNDYKDKEIAKKMYRDMLETVEQEYAHKTSDVRWADFAIYKAFVNPIESHYDVIILCDQLENIWIDEFCAYLKDHFSIEVINLNELFSKGEIGSIYIDRKKIANKAVDVRRAAAIRAKESLESSRDGRLRLVTKIMSKKEKIQKLKELGIRVTENDKDNLDALLIDSWVDELDSDDNGS